MMINKKKTVFLKILANGALFVLLGSLAGGVFDAAQSKPGDHSKEIGEIKQQIEKEPSNITLWMELGKLYGWDEDVPAAAASYEKAIEIDPKNLEARKKLVDFYSWNSNPQGSAKEAEEILKVEPDNLDIMAKLGQRYMTLGQKDKAEDIFNRILEKDPANLQAKKGLAALNSFNSRYDQAIKNYLEILPSITTQKDKADVYESVANNYYAERSYGKAREYAEEALRMDPEDKGAQRLLEKVKSLLKTRLFTDYRNQKFKGDSHRQIFHAGFTKPTEHGYSVTGIYKRYLETAISEDRYSYNAANLEINKYYGDGLTVTLGGEAKFYSVDKARFDYYFGAVKDFRPGLRGNFLYRKITEDSDLQKLEQRVDRHSISATFYQDINDRLSLNTNLEGRYFTKGNAFSDNFSILGYISPVIHVSKDPFVLDVAYTYYRIYTDKKDRNEVESFEYFAPRRFQNHAATAYLEKDITKNLKLVASDTIGWVDEPDVEEIYVQNTVLAELIWKINEDQRVSVRYIRTQNIHNGSETNYKNDELRVQYSIKF